MTASPLPPAVVAEPDVVPDRPDERSRPAPTAMAAALGGALLAGVGGALVGWAPRGVVLVVLIPVQGALALAWLTLARVPARLAGASIAISAGVAAGVLLVAERRPSPGGLSGVIGLGVVAAVLGQLLRRDRSRVTDVLAAQCAAVLLVVAVAAPLALAAYRHGGQAAAAALFGLGLALFAGQLGVPERPWRMAAAAGVGVLVAAGVGLAVLGGTGAAVAATAAIATAASSVVVAVVAGQRRVARALAVTAPYALAGPCAYLVARVMLG